MVYCTSDTLPLVEVSSGTKFTAPFGSAFTKCRRTSNGLKLQHTIKQVCLSVGLFPFGEHRFLDVIPIGSRIIGGFIGVFLLEIIGMSEKVPIYVYEK